MNLYKFDISLTLESFQSIADFLSVGAKSLSLPINSSNNCLAAFIAILLDNCQQNYRN